MRYRCCLFAVLFIAFVGGLPAQTAPAVQTTPPEQTVPPGQTAAPAQATAQHEANFEAERKQANDLFVAGKTLEALPLYEDLCRQDPTSAVFAERHAAGLIAKIAVMPDGPDREAVAQRVLAELRRAQSLGDNSPYLQTLLSILNRNALTGAMVSGAPLTVGYTYAGTPEAQAIQKEAEAAFVNHEIDKALKLYESAAIVDPKWYTPRLDAGDMYYRMKDATNAGIWFQRAIDIDPDRDTAYRYWGDAIYKSGDSAGAKMKYEQAVVAEPYAKPAWIALQQWATVTKTPVSRPEITRPEFTTPDGKLQVDPALTTETGDGHASWLVYQNARVAHGARTLKQPIAGGAYDANGQLTPKGYRHSLAEETECLTAMLASVQEKLNRGIVTPEKLEPSLKLLLQLQKDGMLECWILFGGSDGGIRYDYPGYRKEHRELLVAYVDRYILNQTPAR
jgi:tetratricopeptide (TPR) repeat protein